MLLFQYLAAEIDVSAVEGSSPRGTASQATEVVHEAASSSGTPASLLDAVLAATPTESQQEASPIERLSASRSTREALQAWVDAVGVDPASITLRKVTRLLARDVAMIDAALSRQVNSIIHHPRFQKLEASWRGLQHIVHEIEDKTTTKIRILDVSWRTLVRDLDKSIEFDQSQLFKKVYSEEFDTSGGEPFSVLIGDYDIRPRPRKGIPMDDLDSLRAISQVAAAAFAPFITSANATLLGLDNFTELQRPLNLEAIFEQPEFLKWRSLRDSVDSRFVGLALPKILMRQPYSDDIQRNDGFRFSEDVSSSQLDSYLWGNAAYAYASVLLRSFALSGWLADVRGVRPGLEEGGLVTGLPTQTFGTDAKGVATKSSTDVMLTDLQEDELGKLGFLPLTHCKDTEFCAFFSGASVQKATRYDKDLATANAQIGTMMPYMLCVSRVAHHFKVLGREKVGSFAEAQDVENFLNEWLQQYVTQDDDAHPEIKAQYPLREARVEVREQPGKPGCYFSVVHLQPHYQFDTMNSAVSLTTELAPTSG